MLKKCVSSKYLFKGTLVVSASSKSANLSQCIDLTYHKPQLSEDLKYISPQHLKNFAQIRTLHADNIKSAAWYNYHYGAPFTKLFTAKNIKATATHFQSYNVAGTGTDLKINCGGWPAQISR